MDTQPAWNGQEASWLVAFRSFSSAARTAPAAAGGSAGSAGAGALLGG
jgi:hypothetical protein